MNLYWLPKPIDFSKKIAAIRSASPDEAWKLMVQAAQADLNFLETMQLDKLLTERFKTNPPAGLSTRPIRLALLRSCTVEQLLPGIRVAALRRNLWLTAYLTDFGQPLQELIDPQSRLHQFKPTAVLIAYDAIQLLGTRPPTMSKEGAQVKLDEALGQLKTLWHLAKDRFGCQVIQQTPLPLFLPLMGNNEQRFPDSPAYLLHELNGRLAQMAEENKIDVLDLDAQLAQEGLAAWHNPSLWHKGKQEISPVAGPVYGDLVGRLLAAHQGRSSKCLVLDLDNTLWGGVIGDDGVEGIQLGQGSSLGESFVAFQRYARDLARRGVILAVCSKNDEANALAPFENHPEMALKRSDIACFVANWNDKASNLKFIAEQLNIGLDSLVFVDDNPYERHQVRDALPMVAVPEMPEDPALYGTCVAAGGYFESLSLTPDDLERSEQYQKNMERSQAQASFADISEYLKSLNMELIWGPVDALSLTRSTQLLNKSNQFNLMTHRYSEEQMAAFASDPNAVTLRTRLTDRFGDNGIIGVVVAKKENAKDWLVDSWLMSCRVLGRGVEKATLQLLVQAVMAQGGDRLIGQYKPTAKNGMVKDHYGQLGFTLLDADETGYTRWELRLRPDMAFDHFIQLKQGN